MEWYHYFSGFWAGLFLANFVPHFVLGISGNRFPTPFAKPPGRGLSSPALNVVWALINLLIGYWLLRLGRISFGNDLSLILFFTGICFSSVFLSIRFAGKHQQ